MSMIVLYTSKYGTVKQVAERFAKECNCTAVDMKDFQGNISEYESIVLGANVYVGRLSKECKNFVKQHHEILQGKRIAMFLCGLNSNQHEKVICENLGEAFYQHLYTVDTLGGTLDFQKMNFAERRIIEMINKQNHMFEAYQKKEVINLLEEKRIMAFLEKIKTAV